MRVDAARVLLATNPAEADRVLAAAYEDAQTAIADIRRLVFDLRPSALDGTGLAGALRNQAARFEEASGGRLRIRVETPSHLGALPAALEVAVYRIASEALANIARHSQARTCTIRLTAHPRAADSDRDYLQVDITDDGVGLPARPRAGIGLASMRDRARQFGGEFCSYSVEPHGTRLWIRLALDTRHHTSLAGQDDLGRSG
jgi:signal transduction histidine kinase